MTGRSIPPRASKVEIGEVAWLRVLDADDERVWLDWGRPKDLFMPRRECVGRVAPGQYCLVAVFADREGRATASMRLHDFVRDASEGLSDGDKVTLVIADQTDLGTKAIVNHRFWGLLYADETFQRLRKGQRLDGWVRLVRPDGKLDLGLTPPGYGAVDPLTDVVLARIEAAGGFLPLTDKSPPEAIYAAFAVSKKQFKQAIGALYKERKITLEPGGLRRAAETGDVRDERPSRAR